MIGKPFNSRKKQQNLAKKEKIEFRRERERESRKTPAKKLVVAMATASSFYY